jgi:acetyl esterase/lipase
MRLLALLALSALAATAQQRPAQPVEKIWQNGAPGALGTEDGDQPAITIYLAPPAKATGTAVVVCPGGGYGALAMDHEGKQIAEWLNGLGVSAFVLKYRLGPKYHHPAMMQDVQQAIRTVRSRAAEFHIRPDRIGVWGFSAGGHLASTAATHFETANGISSRPDFAILAYPVISMKDPYVHQGSRRNLLGDNPDPALINLMSNETQVTPQTPPTFIFFTTDDAAVPVENGLMFYEALHKAGVPAEMHIFESGHHGLGLAPNDPAISWWPKMLAEWLRGRGLLSRPTAS